MKTAERPVIGFLTDFGLDGAAATCRAVMLGICPDAQIVDISHTIRKYAIRDGAFLLRFALPYFPIGVHVAVVDPGVGTERRPIAVATGRGDVLIGPDNGLLLPPAEVLGGAVAARELANRELWLPATTSTFHGRDIFAPVAAALAAGAPLADAGDRIDPNELTSIDLPEPTLADGSVTAHALLVDGFGNVALDAGHEQLAGSGLALGHAVGVELPRTGARHRALFARSFADVPADELLLYEDAYRMLALAVNRGDAATLLGVAPDDEVRLSRR